MEQTNSLPNETVQSEPLVNSQVKPSSSKKTVLIVLFILLLVGLSSLIAYLFFKSQTSFQTPEISPLPTIQASTSPSDSWTLHKSTILGVEFKLPPKLGLLEMSGQEIKGEKGTQYCMLFGGSLSRLSIHPVYAGSGPCGGGLFNLGTVSFDYEAGREGGFGDYTGYVLQNEKYYPRFLNNTSKNSLPSNLVTERTNANGVKYLRIVGENELQDWGGEMREAPIMGTPGKGYLGALINIVNQKYAGFNISMEIKSPGEEEVFDQILSTFKFLDQNQTDTIVDWKTYTNNDFSFKFPPSWIISTNRITGINPKVVINIIEKDKTLINECMQLDKTERTAIYVVKRFSRIATGEMCATTDTSPRENWVIPTESDYAPGISYLYSEDDKAQAEEIFNQILSTFKFN